MRFWTKSGSGLSQGLPWKVVCHRIFFFFGEAVQQTELYHNKPLNAMISDGSRPRFSSMQRPVLALCGLAHKAPQAPQREALHRFAVWLNGKDLSMAKTRQAPLFHPRIALQNYRANSPSGRSNHGLDAYPLYPHPQSLVT